MQSYWSLHLIVISNYNGFYLYLALLVAKTRNIIRQLWFLGHFAALPLIGCYLFYC